MNKTKRGATAKHRERKARLKEKAKVAAKAQKKTAGAAAAK
ncbi:MAG: hypothetical protein V2A77_09365 [Pseudomonadota bacterium]